MSTMPFSTSIDNKKQIQIKQNYPIHFLHPKVTNFFIFLQAGIRIINAKKKEKKLSGSEKEIIQKIHHIRYADENSYVTTGGHFSQLYVRNLGIFLNALLDPRIPSSEEDWVKRQSIALRTIALDLEVFRKSKKAYTTIVHVGKHFYSAMNMYTEPSDSLFGIVYTLCALQDKSFIPSLFPAPDNKQQLLQTKAAAQKLIQQHTETLRALIKDYKSRAIDSKTGLIKKDIYLASARDGIKRQSSFYDNVICWSTFYLAEKLHLIALSEKELLSWKEHIIATFWDEEEGIFLDDVSQESKREKRFSADAFIVTSSSFFDIKNKNDMKKLQQMTAYVQKNELDKPFPLAYSKDNHLSKLYWPVRFGAPAYMGKSIWSHWGMEYIKALILIGKSVEAKKYLLLYKENIEHYGGYPELYDPHGKIYTTLFYRGVLHNSWVINYEQAKMMLTPPNLPLSREEKELLPPDKGD
ncbi:MAG TPA: hypothetical protein VLG12_08630 [Candidatus Saccharimonadales bacterium]|nr:hypothetical protein [Candidatus Saccharimonadales bacterium]